MFCYTCESELMSFVDEGTVNLRWQAADKPCKFFLDNFQEHNGPGLILMV